MKKILFILLHLVVTHLFAVDLPEGFVQQKLDQNLNPTSLTLSPDGRLFVLEKDGVIRVYRDGELLNDKFLTLENVDIFDERGLQSMVFDPDFETNNYYYVYYSHAESGKNRVSRFTANGDGTLLGSEKLVMEFYELQASIHNGGAMAFGDDGKLYVCIGDDGQGWKASNNNFLQGKILRINKDGTIPEDNPMYDEYEGKLKAMWASGFRNPFSMSVSSSGEIYINDVGQSSYEEVNHLVKGGYYGWPLVEGYREDQNVPDNYVDPIYAYHHSVGCAIVGSMFFEPEQSTFPEKYLGQYYFADYCRGIIFRLNPDEPEETETFIEGLTSPVYMEFGHQGEMYYVQRGEERSSNTSTDDGNLWVVRYLGTGEPFITETIEDRRASLGDSVVFEVSALGDAPLSYQWQRDSVDIEGATSASLTIKDLMLSDSGSYFRCIVFNELSSDTTNDALLRVTANKSPQVTIQSPLKETYQAGDTLVLKGMAVDQEDGDIPEEALSWVVHFHHNTHIHPGLSVSGTDSTGYEIPIIGETSTNVWYRVYLTAEDSRGMTSTQYVDVFPELTTISIETTPPGLKLELDGFEKQTPYVMNAVKGMVKTFNAPEIVTNDDSIYRFQNWYSGTTTNVLEFIPRADNLFFGAYYTGFPLGKGDGLSAKYYDGESNLDNDIAVASVVDSVVNFNWGFGRPYPDLLDYSDFGIIWTGFIKPKLSVETTLLIEYAGGMRFYLDNTLVHEDWKKNGPKKYEHTFDADMNTFYPIKIVFFDFDNNAVARLFWKSELMNLEVVPQSQLYSSEQAIINDIDIEESSNINLFPNPCVNTLFISGLESKAKVSIKNQIGQSIQVNVSREEDELRIDTDDLPSGVYFLEISEEGEFFYRKFIKH